MTENVTKYEPQQPQQGGELISLIERLVSNPNADVDKLMRLVEMQDQIRRQQSKTAYLDAFARLQSDLPAAIKRGKSHNGMYARYEDIIEAIRPQLAKHGFSISHRVSNTADSVTVTGILGHSAGHSEETQITLPADKSGSKNPVQAIGSAVSYGKRYVTLTLTGIATEGEDDDGNKADQSKVITAEQVELLKKLTKETDSPEKLVLKAAKAEKFEDIKVNDYQRVIAQLSMKKERMP